MDTLEKFDIFRETNINNQINDKLTVKLNIIFDIIVRNDPHRGLPSTYSVHPYARHKTEQSSHTHTHTHTHTRTEDIRTTNHSGVLPAPIHRKQRNSELHIT
jgi:hypothetical protein